MQQILQMFGKDRLWIIRDQIITIMAITITITTAAMAVVSSLRWMSGKVWMSISRCKMLMIFPILWGGEFA